MMNSRVAGTLLIVLGGAIGFALAWIFLVASGLHLVISVMLLISGAIIGFAVEWLVSEKRLHRKEDLPLPPAEVADPATATPLAESQQPSQSQELERLAEKIQQHEAELQQLVQQVSAKETQFEGLNAQFDLYRKSHPDSLIGIRGIGPVYQRKLREIGINSFAQLAATDPGQLRQALGVKHWQRVDIASWVRQANEWNNGSSYD
jgi:predicted flap endonuclease-1-like 5' DNA nuclease